MMISVVIADDHAIFRRGLAELLCSEDGITLSGQAADGEEAMALILEKQPDIAILDITMPKLSGIDLAKKLSAKGLNTKVILLTMHKDSLTAARAIESGISGYVLKDNTYEELIYAVKTVMAGGVFITPSVAGGILKHKAGRTELATILTAREKEIMQLIVKGMTSHEIAEKLFISVKTVETHRSRIMSKLSVHKSIDLVKIAMESGLTGE
jgi:DNA-binding NarL/FixJ family response regulator